MEGPAALGPAWGQGLSGHGRHYELARGDSIPSCRSLYASPLESEGVFLLKDSALRKRGEEEEQEEEVGGEREEEERRSRKKTTSGENEDEHADCENVQELSDLFSSIESEASGDHAIDFSVLLEGEHAFNVEEVSEIFSDLEDVAVNEQDAQCVDDVAALFTALEEQDTDAESDSDSAQDAENVDELSELFSALEEQDTADEQAHEDWIASLDVDHVSSLFTELEELQQREEEVKSQVPTAVAVPPPTVAVDPRIFVPSQSVRMEGRRMPVAMALPRVSAGARLDTSAFLVGPPCLRAGPPVLMAEKRKLSESPSPTSRPADPIISETRRASAAKRRRVNGRFVREQNAFVSITQLQ